jgi:hypothetical protein
MSEDILSTMQDLVRINAISSDQIPEITVMYTEMKKNWAANPARSLLEPLKSSVPPSWLKIGGITYEDAWLLWMAVAASNAKRAFQSAQQFSNNLFSSTFFQPKGE